MNFAVNTQITEFLEETEQYMGQLDELQFDAAADFYDLLDEAADIATVHIEGIDPELRVMLCDRRDKVIERVVDTLPSFTHLGEPLGIYTPAIQGYRTWSNAELMKDKGLAGYLLARGIGGNATMFFGTKPSDYPYLSELPDMDMLYENSDNIEAAYRRHLEEEREKMDILILHGMYPHTAAYLKLYKELQPGGKVYCGLDMNSRWTKEIKWANSEAKEFADMCDVTATSCRSVRDMLNRRADVNFACHWLPNGFYNPSNMPIVADPGIKENVILTVARLGIPEKNNVELLAGFAEAAKSKALDGWTLRLVGPIEPMFEASLSGFFKEYPNMKGRVIFTGQITDKAELYAEYAKAKIFALTSRVEGGTPNVYAEALFHGCMFITSNIDAADDITNYEQLGKTYKFGDVPALVRTITKMCKNADISEMQRHIPKALEYAARYYDWNRNAKKLAYMLFK